MGHCGVEVRTSPVSGTTAAVHVWRRNPVFCLFLRGLGVVLFSMSSPVFLPVYSPVRIRYCLNKG